MKILFICTSNADRSPALEKYFSSVYPQHEYRSAGINKYFTSQKGTHYLTQDDIDWADLIVFAEMIHKQITKEKFIANFIPPNFPPFPEDEISTPEPKKVNIILNCGNYERGALSDDYLTCAEQKLKNILK